MSRLAVSHPAIPCAYCGKPTPPTYDRVDKLRKGKPVYCNTACYNRTRAEPFTKTCEWCGNEFARMGRLRAREKEGGIRFCGKACSAKARWSQSEFRAKAKAGMEASCTEQVRQSRSARMKARNPMDNPATVAKVSRALQGRTFLSRGGKGQLTEPQKALSAALGWPDMEHPIPTAAVKGQFPSLPNSYAVDIAHPEARVAVEIDGHSHRTRKWKFLDKRKTAVLTALGWCVLRFTNERVNAELSAVVEEIRSFTTSRLQALTTTSQPG